MISETKNLALTLALEHYRGTYASSDDVVKTANKFETYLNEGADDKQDAAITTETEGPPLRFDARQRPYRSIEVYSHPTQRVFVNGFEV